VYEILHFIAILFTAITDQYDGNGAPVAIIVGGVAVVVPLVIILLVLCCGVWLY